MKRELQKYSVTAYWWNFRKKKLDFSGNLYDLLDAKGIKVRRAKDRKNPTLDCYVFTTPHNIIYKHFGDVKDGAFTALKLWYATMGDKATVNMQGRTFTINH